MGKKGTIGRHRRMRRKEKGENNGPQAVSGCQASRGKTPFLNIDNNKETAKWRQGRIPEVLTYQTP
jgi:hypothetical protein